MIVSKVGDSFNLEIEIVNEMGGATKESGWFSQWMSRDVTPI